MSIFDYPRINFIGILTLKPGTANNDDYSGQFRRPGSGENLALINSATVEPITFGMSDEDFRVWMMQPHTFEQTGGRKQTLIPAEWNFYGDMSSSADARVVGVQTGPSTLYTAKRADAPLSQLVGAPVSLSGNITDINSEGSPPGTQFFLNKVSLKVGDIEISGTASKAACQWIYFTRNVAMAGDAGAGGYMYHVLENGRIALPGLDDPEIVGAVLRYYVYAKHGTVDDIAGIEKLYANKAMNPALFQITGTLAPLYRSETIRSAPVGRLLACDVPAIDTPTGVPNNAKNGKLALAPAVLACEGDRISVDFLGSFPERMDPSVADWSDPTLKNPKYNFGPVTLALRGAGDAVDIGTVPYAETEGGEARGWVFDFDISGDAAARKLLADPDATFHLRSDKYGDVLAEADYYIVSNQQAVYAEQDGSPDRFVSQGLPMEAAEIAVFHRGEELSAAKAPRVTVWGYRTTPLGFSGARETLDESFGPGRPLSIDTSKAGTFLLTFGVAGASGPVSGEPPQRYAHYIAAPFTVLTNRPAISARVLPNEDFSAYLEDGPDGPVTKDAVTFDFVYQKTLRTYDLLFPAMAAIFSLKDENAVATAAACILARTDLKMWRDPRYMPITRDLSESRRALLQAWCRRVIRDRAA